MSSPVAQQAEGDEFLLDQSSVSTIAGRSSSEEFDAVTTAGEPVGAEQPSSESYVVEGGLLIVPFPVEIDVKPGDPTNAVNPMAGGVVSVAILTTSAFDAAQVDISLDENGESLLKLSGSAARIKGNSNNYASFEDVDDDGDEDLVVQFYLSGVFEELVEMGGESAYLTLKGQTVNGSSFSGSDQVLIVNQ